MAANLVRRNLPPFKRHARHGPGSIYDGGVQTLHGLTPVTFHTQTSGLVIIFQNLGRFDLNKNNIPIYYTVLQVV